MRAWNSSSFHSRSGGCVCARRGCTFSTSVAQMQLACSPAGIFFCENSERTYVIQCLSRARHRGTWASRHRGSPREAGKRRNVEMTQASSLPSPQMDTDGTERHEGTKAGSVKPSRFDRDRDWSRGRDEPCAPPRRVPSNWRDQARRRLNADRCLLKAALSASLQRRMQARLAETTSAKAPVQFSYPVPETRRPDPGRRGGGCSSGIHQASGNGEGEAGREALGMGGEARVRQA